jgi:hypothetical protein
MTTGPLAPFRDERKDGGAALASGVYFSLPEADRASTSGKVTLLR